MEGKRSEGARCVHGRDEQISELINTTINHLERLNWPNARQSLDHLPVNDWRPSPAPHIKCKQARD